MQGQIEVSKGFGGFCRFKFLPKKKTSSLSPPSPALLGNVLIFFGTFHSLHLCPHHPHSHSNSPAWISIEMLSHYKITFVPFSLVQFMLGNRNAVQFAVRQRGARWSYPNRADELLASDQRARWMAHGFRAMAPSILRIAHHIRSLLKGILFWKFQSHLAARIYL